MKIAFAADHRGFKLKNTLIRFLESKGYRAVDFGTHSQDACDYPDYVYPACAAVKRGEAERAVILCYTGIGSAIAANKVRGIRAALVYSLKSAQLSRRHNDANVLVLPTHLMNTDRLKRVILAWLKADFEGGRHLRRVAKIAKIEEKENV